jgi:cation diffusion facilitator CzcD-associated flavoprotein CzcO
MTATNASSSALDVLDVLDVLIVGAGFSGLYLLDRLRERGFIDRF